MKKPQSLRDFLTDALPELARDPDRLLVFIDRGSLVATMAPGQSFEYSFTLNLIVTDYAGHPDAVMVPLLDWIRINQPELLANPKQRGQIAFEADILANDKIDLDIKLPLTERVGVHRDAEGVVTVEHYCEPTIDAPCPPRHWKLYLQEELLAEWDAPGG